MLYELTNGKDRYVSGLLLSSVGRGMQRSYQSKLVDLFPRRQGRWFSQGMQCRGGGDSKGAKMRVNLPNCFRYQIVEDGRFLVRDRELMGLTEYPQPATTALPQAAHHPRPNVTTSPTPPPPPQSPFCHDRAKDLEWIPPSGPPWPTGAHWGPLGPTKRHSNLPVPSPQ